VSNLRIYNATLSKSKKGIFGFMYS